MMKEERVLSCEGFRKPEGDEFGRSLHATASLQALCGLAGTMAALQAIKLALALGAPVKDTLLEVCAHTWRSHVTPIRGNPTCPCSHERFEILAARRALSDCTLGELPSVAGVAKGGGAVASISVEGFRWAERGLCGCAESSPVNRLVRAGESKLGRCTRCRKTVHAQPFFSHDAIPLSSADHFRDRTLRSLGAANCRGVIIRRDNKAVLLTNPRPKANA